MGCTGPLRRWVGAPHQYLLGVGSKQPLPLYADVRLHIPMTEHIPLGTYYMSYEYKHVKNTSRAMTDRNDNDASYKHETNTSRGAFLQSTAHCQDVEQNQNTHRFLNPTLLQPPRPTPPHPPHPPPTLCKFYFMLMQRGAPNPQFFCTLFFFLSRVADRKKKKIAEIWVSRVAENVKITPAVKQWSRVQDKVHTTGATLHPLLLLPPPLSGSTLLFPMYAGKVCAVY